MSQEKVWFERDEHINVRKCTCACGHIYESHARDLPCIEKRERKDSRGALVRDKNGNQEFDDISVTRMISKWACPKCRCHSLVKFT